MSDEIDLGVKNSERFKSEPYTISGPKSEDIHYPSFVYSGPDELELPEEGEMTISFKKVSETSSVRDGKHWYECTIEVHKICDVDEEDDDDDDNDEVRPPSISHSEAADALDKIAAELAKLKQHEKEGMSEERDQSERDTY